MTDRIRRHVEDGLCTLTLDRAEKRNALDLAMFEGLSAAIDAIEIDDSIGCVVLRGAGPAFSAGADLGAVSSDGYTPSDFKPGTIARLATLRVPTIAAIHGVCFTGGLELALACDFLVADQTARFADTHGRWGFVGAWGISQRLPRRIGLAPAKRMMMTGRVVEADEALALGLVDLLAPDGGLDETVAALARDILANSGFTNVAVKHLLIATDGMPLAAALEHERRHHPGMAPDYRERIAGFAARKG